MDLVVVGGGLAGLVAAARASELGRSVTVLEAGADERYICNARFSGGVFHIAFTEIKSQPEALRAAIDRQTDGKADPAQADALAAGAGRLVDWLKTQGAQYVRTQVPWQSHILAPPRPIVAGQEWRGRGPDVLLRRLVEKIEVRGGKVERGTRAQKLIMANGRCLGVEAVTGGQLRTFPARARCCWPTGGFRPTSSCSAATSRRSRGASNNAVPQRASATDCAWPSRPGLRRARSIASTGICCAAMP